MATACWPWICAVTARAAAGENELGTSFNQLFARTLGERATLWVVPGVPHTGAYSRYPEEYERRVLAFLDEHLLRAE
jgi:fermentation-respiration switch protein FrsA (DUF1100 family)